MMVAMWTRTMKGTLEHPISSSVALDSVVYVVGGREIERDAEVPDFHVLEIALRK
jgi:hypothetical protein